MVEGQVDYHQDHGRDDDAENRGHDLAASSGLRGWRDLHRAGTR
ncbi:MAG: hypothetical protein ACRDN0_34585 [Trebonia sp.]